MSVPARELDLRDYIGVARRRWAWIVIAPLVAMVLAISFTVSRPRVFEGATEVLILTEANQAIFQTTGASAERLHRNAVTEHQLLSGEEFRDRAAPIADGAQSIGYEVGRTGQDEDLGDVAILRFVVHADTASGAAAAANEIAVLYIETRHAQDRSRVDEQLEDQNAALVRLRAVQGDADERLASLREQLDEPLTDAEQAQLTTEIAVLEAELFDLAGRVLRTIEEIAALEQVASDLDDPFAAARIHNSAEIPTSPISPYLRRNIVLAAVAGLALGVALAVARDLLDRSARDPVGLARATGVPVLGSIELVPRDPGEVASLTGAHQYQTILRSLALSSDVPELRTVGITSATESVGKTETAINLARVSAAAGLHVLVVDADPFAPMVAVRLEPSERRTISLAKALAGEPAPAKTGSAGKQAAGRSRRSRQPSGARRSGRVPKIDVVDLFSSEGPATDLLGQTSTEAVFERLRERYDLILIDAHATLSAFGVRSLLTDADAVVVVYVPDRSNIDDLAQAVALLRDGGVSVTGLVANQVKSVRDEFEPVLDDQGDVVP